MSTGEVGGKARLVAMHEETDVTLRMQRDVARLVAADARKAHALEKSTQGFRVWPREFHEGEAIGAHRIGFGDCGHLSHLLSFVSPAHPVPARADASCQLLFHTSVQLPRQGKALAFRFM